MFLSRHSISTLLCHNSRLCLYTANILGRSCCRNRTVCRSRDDLAQTLCSGIPRGINPWNVRFAVFARYQVSVAIKRHAVCKYGVFRLKANRNKYGVHIQMIVLSAIRAAKLNTLYFVPAVNPLRHTGKTKRYILFGANLISLYAVNAKIGSTINQIHFCTNAREV